MLTFDSNIVANASRAVPSDRVYMSTRIGDVDKITDLNQNLAYEKEQKDIIDQSNGTVYQLNQHNEASDIPPFALGILGPAQYMSLSNHSDKGFDYRDFPKELSKHRSDFDPWYQYLYNNGLIGKNKSRYVTQYINIDSANRVKKPVIQTSTKRRLITNPFIFNGHSLRIMVSETQNLTPNEKITITGITEREKILRTFVIDNYGNKVHYFIFEQDKYYMTVNTDPGMIVRSDFTQDILNQYSDIMASFSGFAGDTRTEWYFDTRKFLWSINPLVNNVTGQTTYDVLITENVFAVSENTASNPETTQIRQDLVIAIFSVDEYGTVINIYDPLNKLVNENLRWTQPPLTTGTPPIGIPESFYTDSQNQLTVFNLSIPPTTPTTFYVAMEYFQNVQNVIRPILLNIMSNDPLNINFGLRYNFNNSTYTNSVRFIVPESTTINQISTIGNMSLNLLNSKHRIYLTSQEIEQEFGINAVPIIPFNNQNKFFIKLDQKFTKRVFEYLNPLGTGALMIRVYDESKSDVTIKYHHYGGVPVNIINSSSTTGYNYITQVVDNQYVLVDLDRIGYYDGFFGGSEVQIGNVTDLMSGYYQPNRYQIELDKVYTRIVMIKMISSIFPKTQTAFMNGLSGGHRNNRLYWQNIDDGEIVYMIEIEQGDYEPNELKYQIETEIRKIMRVNEKEVTDVRNYMIVDIDEKTNKVVFSNFDEYVPNDAKTYVKQIKIININQNTDNDPDDLWYLYPSGGYFKHFPNANSIRIKNAIRVKIYQPGNRLNIGDSIIIKNSLNYENIPASYLNQTHIITNILGDYYDILLFGVNTDPSLSWANRGGIDLRIYSQNSFRLRFDYPDTMGYELGFRDVGSSGSITPYAPIITNDVVYESENIYNIIKEYSNANVDGFAGINVENIGLRNALSIRGPPYFLIRCKELANLINVPGSGSGYGPYDEPNTLTLNDTFGSISSNDYFYKINLKSKDKHTKFIFDTFADTPLFYTEPLRYLDSLTLEFVTPDGNLYDFNGIDHSFVLEIVTHQDIPEHTSIRDV